MADHRRIMQLLLQGHSYREICAIAGCSTRDVSRANQTIKTYQITAPALEAMSQERLAQLFPDGRSKITDDYAPPNFDRVVKSMKANPHFTVHQAWREYASSSSKKRKYVYSQYSHLFRSFLNTHDLVAVLQHEPGRAVFVDWAGDTIGLVDRGTGEVTRAYLFVATLPFSGYVFCQAFTSLGMEAWLAAHVAAFEFFDGVPQILVPDNAATATYRKTKGDPARTVTERYQQLADHYGVSIVPAQPRRPRQKAAVESSVNTINKRVLGYLNEETYATLTDLNAAIDRRMHEINHDIKRANDTTRHEVFTTEEAERLAPLPEERFEEVTWKEAKVARNYHLTSDYQHYSVPYRLAGQSLRLRLTSGRVTVFDGQQIVAEHQRLVGRKGQYSTDPAHVPAAHRDIHGLWSRTWFIGRAETFGEATAQVITQMLDRPTVEAQAYLPCQNVLETLGKKNKARLEAACQQLLNMRSYPSYSTIKRIMAGIETDADHPAPARPAASTRKPAAVEHPDEDAEVFVRGADYYTQGW